ncbi:efflux transporter outer membrane subunit [Marinomonas rhizomae]|uniref:Multidrug efflux system outer membrane protein n=1 Tax=Marinomonas rhizomae TaxID=491948 RepID=A0A366IYW1_9GAMM|nr:efflux transporter outer membrane subunit [Marinomonas rhizomae]RBP79035.1 multidrug efflux system outer membrane protein [Marinomonas rhizomae]RNF71259.1 efflux transporter outer membrane subunit [Marinomonas rhizomae]
MINMIKLMPFLLLTGCATVGPNWESPTTPLTSTFVSGDNKSIDEVAYTPWWREFNDPILTELVETGFSQNLDILQARERIQEANAELRKTGINSALEGSLSYSRLRSGGENQSTSISSTTGLSASYVIDLFGGVERAREAALANLVAAQADVGTERLAWLAEVVANYADARYYQQALDLTRNTISTRNSTLEVTQREYDAGLSTLYELAEAEAALQSAQAELPSYQALFRSKVFAIATLLDQPAKPLIAKIEESQSQLNLPSDPAIGLPADLLRNRPDIRYQEAILHQEVAETGVDESSLYPSISLTGSVSNKDSLDSWSFGPSISLGIFNRGYLNAQRDAQESVAKQAEIAWRASVQDAVEDVQVAQSNLSLYREQTELLVKAASSYSKALKFGYDNYKNGAMTLLDLLDTVRLEANAQISAAYAYNTSLQEWASLQIAIGAGAGFSDIPEQTADSTTQEN